MKVSVWKMLWKRLWGGKEAVFDYLLDLANNCVDRIPGATKERLAEVYKAAVDIRARMEALGWIVPKAWRKYYAGVLDCLDAVLSAVSDGRVTGGELSGLVESFRSAYAAWRAE
jgi:hypothetical protein